MKCLHDQCERGTYRGTGVCYAHTVYIRCELESCQDWVWSPYTTCKAHTDLLVRMGQEPQRLMSGTIHYQGLKMPDEEKKRDEDLEFDFRFSASYASRYHNCHGSANLTAAIPGFVFPERNEDGMKGDGTKLHKIFQHANLSGRDLRDHALFLEMIADLYGNKRADFLLTDPKRYLITWFMKYKTAPPFEQDFLASTLLKEKRSFDTDGNVKETKIVAMEPRRIMFLAEALRQIQDIKDSMEPVVNVIVEEKVQATWLKTAPNTTADLVMYDSKTAYVIDLKMGDVPVSAEDNEQLMYYGLTYLLPDKLHLKINLVILQRNNLSTWVVPLAKLNTWMEDMQKSEQAILDGDLTLTPGDHCKFCPANPHSRGDRGNKVCQPMQYLLYGMRDLIKSDEDMLDDEDIYQ